jgi:hypothetical protein
VVLERVGLGGGSWAVGWRLALMEFSFIGRDVFA